MLSFQQWRMLNESFAGSYNLGLTNPQNLGLHNSSGFGLGLEEAKAKHMKKSKKKMDPDEADGEIVDAAAPKDDVDVDIDDDDVDVDDEGDDVDPCGGKKFCGKNSKKKSKKKMMKSKKKMWSDEDDAEADLESGDDAGLEDEDDAGLEDAEEDAGEDLDGDDEEGEDEDHIAAVKGKKKPFPPAPMDTPMMSKKKSKKKMKSEAFLDNDEEWLASVRGMMHSDLNQKFDDGFTRYYEDALFTPVDPNQSVQSDEPGPGQVGFAPSQRLG